MQNNKVGQVDKTGTGSRQKVRNLDRTGNGSSLKRKEWTKLALALATKNRPLRLVLSSRIGTMIRSYGTNMRLLCFVKWLGACNALTLLHLLKIYWITIEKIFTYCLPVGSPFGFNSPCFNPPNNFSIGAAE